MKLTFSWKSTAGRWDPLCVSNVVNKDGISLLACLLMDDGGQGHLDAVPWISEGIARIGAVHERRHRCWRLGSRGMGGDDEMRRSPSVFTVRRRLF